MKFLEKKHLHPFLIAVYAVLFLYWKNIGEVRFHEIVSALGMALVTAAAIFLLAVLMVKGRERAAVLSTTALFFFFSFGHLYHVLDERNIEASFLSSYELSFTILSILFIVFSVFIMKTSVRLNKVVAFLNMTFIFLVAVSVFQISHFSLKTMTTGDLSDVAGSPALTQNTVGLRHPDIYYIVLDRYADSETLRTKFGFDNAEFLDYLASRGFYIAEKSKTNYPATYLSLASSLNMRYLEGISQSISDSRNHLPYYEHIAENKVAKFLKKAGYTYVHAGSWWGPTMENTHADMNINLHVFPNEFSRNYYCSTMLAPLVEVLGLYDFRKLEWERVRYKFEELENLPDFDSPAFVFSHFLITHPPYVFEADGSYLRKDRADPSLRENYVKQVKYANMRLRIFIEKILSRPEPPVIVLQADEGPNPWEFSIPGSKSTEGMEDLKEKTGILNAYYLPHVKKSPLYPTITPVNTFRVILNSYFGTRLNILPDNVYDARFRPLYKSKW